jgi:hypothetical protein
LFYAHYIYIYIYIYIQASQYNREREREARFEDYYRLSGSKRRQRIISKKHMAEGGTTLEYTPTWVVAVVCSVIVLISLIVERTLHYLGKVTHHLPSHIQLYMLCCMISDQFI